VHLTSVDTSIVPTSMPCLPHIDARAKMVEMPHLRISTGTYLPCLFHHLSELLNADPSIWTLRKVVTCRSHYCLQVREERPLVPPTTI